MSSRQAALLAALAAIWGGSYLLIKYALEDLDAPVIVWARTALAALVLLAALGPTAARSALADLRRRPGSAALLGLVAIALPFSLITLGEHTVPSGLTAVLIAPSSLFVALFAPFLDPAEGIDRRQAAGMLVGLAGVALVVGVESVHSVGAVLGALAMIVASACYGLSGFVVKGRYGRLTSVQTSFVSVLTASLMMLPFAAATAPHSLPGLRATLAVLVLGALGTALAFVIFYRLMQEIGPARASLVSYLAPGVALLYGAVLLGERVTVASVTGLVLILGGVAISSRQPLRKRATAARLSASSTLSADSPSGSVTNAEGCRT